ncbi:MAG: hypothetical protein VX223_01460 [Myxococcota bacterium]|nr:hypothetical protein [Myxococcota bacterium]
MIAFANMGNHRTAWRGFFVVALLMLGAQLTAVWGTFYLATDDYLIMTFGRADINIERLFARQTGGTPAIRPVSLLLSRLEFLAFGEAVMPRIAINACINVLSGAMLALILDGLFKRPKYAILTGLAFIAWPLHAEGLAWFHSGHTSIPIGMLTLSVLAAYARGWSMLTTSILLVIALMTRENAVVTGPLLLAMGWYRHRALTPAMKSILPYAAILLVYVCIRLWQMSIALQGDAQLPVGQDPLATTFYLIFHLLGPVHPGLPGAHVLLAITVISLILLMSRATSKIKYAGFWIVICCLPFAPLYDTGDPLFEAAVSAYERRWYHLYLPAAGMAWLVASAVGEHMKAAVAAIVCLLLLQLANAGWYADLGRDLRQTHQQLADIIQDPAPIALVIPEETLLGGLVEHQVLDIPRIFTARAPMVYRWLPDGDGTEYVRAAQDPFGYPAWMTLRKGFHLPAGTRHFVWNEVQKRLEPGTAPSRPTHR